MQRAKVEFAYACQSIPSFSAYVAALEVAARALALSMVSFTAAAMLSRTCLRDRYVMSVFTSVTASCFSVTSSRSGVTLRFLSRYRLALSASCFRVSSRVSCLRCLMALRTM